MQLINIDSDRIVYLDKFKDIVINEAVLNESSKNKQEAKFWSSGGKSITIKKDNSKSNSIFVITGNNKYKYSIYVKGWTSTDALNFKSLSQNKDNGKVTFNRWIEGGKTEPRTIEVEDMRKILKELKAGKSASVSKMGVAIEFKKTA